MGKSDQQVVKYSIFYTNTSFESIFAAEFNVIKKSTTQSPYVVKNDQLMVKNSKSYTNTSFESIFLPPSNHNEILTNENK